MFRKVIYLAGYVVLIVFIIGTLAFTSSESKHITCSSIDVEFDEDELILLVKNEILNLVISADNQLLGKDLNQINSDFIEAEVEKNQAILKADIFKVIAKDSNSYRGILAIKVKHRKPIVRIMSDSGSYYLDKWGRKIPVSKRYAANVLVSTGYFNEEFAVEKLLPLVLFIENDDLWQAQIEQIHVEKSGEILLTPLFGDHIIELGEISDFREKLRNMKAFYEQVLVENNWNKYESISLKYKNQVVAKQR